MNNIMHTVGGTKMVTFLSRTIPFKRKYEMGNTCPFCSAEKQEWYGRWSRRQMVQPTTWTIATSNYTPEESKKAERSTISVNLLLVKVAHKQWCFRSIPSKRNMFRAVHHSIPVSHAQAIQLTRWAYLTDVSRTKAGSFAHGLESILLHCRCLLNFAGTLCYCHSSTAQLWMVFAIVDQSTLDRWLIQISYCTYILRHCAYIYLHWHTYNVMYSHFSHMYSSLRSYSDQARAAGAWYYVSNVQWREVEIYPTLPSRAERDSRHLPWGGGKVSPAEWSGIHGWHTQGWHRKRYCITWWHSSLHTSLQW